MESKYVIANHKMGLLLEDLPTYLKMMEEVISDHVILCPSSIYLPYFLKKEYSVGLQNLYFGEKDSCTGEISAAQAFQMGVSYVLLGHSDRRLLLDETDLVIQQKVNQCLRHRIKVILCVGETLEEKNRLKTEEVLRRQIKSAFRGLEVTDLKDILIAYEPVWAIGTNQLPKEKDVEVAISYIKSFIQRLYHSSIKVLYGGSITAENIVKINKIPSLDGVLVGGASFDPKQFLKIIEVVVTQ